MRFLILLMLSLGLTSEWGTSVSVRTPNDELKPLDYELSIKLNDTNGKIQYLLKRDWERELGEKYIDDCLARHKVAKAQRKLERRAATIAKRLSKDEKPNAKPWRTTRDAIGDLPDPRHTRKAAAVPDHRFQPGARSYPGHTGSYMDDPSKTLKAGVHGVPGGENMLRRGDGFVRYFTVRESARIQTFPDDYVFHGAWSECMRQLGNAVPAKLAELVGDSVREKLDATKAG